MTAAPGKDNPYTHLTALFADMSTLPAGDPEREHLRTQIIEAGLPIADNIAARYRGRVDKPTTTSSRSPASAWSAQSTASTSTKGKTSCASPFLRRWEKCANTSATKGGVSASRAHCRKTTSH